MPTQCCGIQKITIITFKISGGNHEKAVDRFCICSHFSIPDVRASVGSGAAGCGLGSIVFGEKKDLSNFRRDY